MIKNSNLNNLPIAFFTATMSLSGFTIAWEEVFNIFGLPKYITLVLATICFFIFIYLSALYLRKILKKPKDCKAEFNHYVKSNFLAAISTTLLLLSIVFLNFPEYKSTINLSKALWFFGGSSHLYITLKIISNWIQKDLEIKHITPTWFIPITGNMIAAIASAQHSTTELAWFFFSIGLVLWVVILTTFFYRIIFHHPIPNRLLPTLFILIAPPSAGALAWFNITDQIDFFYRILFYFALFLSALLIFQYKLFLNIRFYLSWWAYSFPIAALTTACLVLYSETEKTAILILSLFWIAVLTIIVAILSYKTIKEVVQNELHINEED